MVAIAAARRHVRAVEDPRDHAGRAHRPRAAAA